MSQLDESVFEDLSVKHGLRKTEILAWLDCERSYGDDQIACLRFIDRDLAKDREDEGTIVDEALISLNDDYEDRLVRL